MNRRSLCRTAGLVVTLVVALGSWSCGGSAAARRGAGSGVWIAAGGSLSTAEAAALEAQDVKELFVESARLSWSGGQPTLETLPLGELPRRTLLTLVVTGELPTTFDAGSAGAALGDLLRQHRLEREGAGLLPRGLHFDLQSRQTQLSAYAELLDEASDRGANGLHVSVTVPRQWVGADGLPRLAKVADSLLVLAYGQRPGELDDPAAWDLTEVRRLLRRVEELGRPYLVGVATLGRVARLDRRGGPLGSTAVVGSLRDLLVSPRLVLARGFSLQGVDRQLWELEAVAATQIGPLQVEREDQVVVSRLASAHLGRYRADLARERLENRLGDVFLRLPVAGEGIGLSASNLVAGLSAEHPAPDLLPAVTLLSRRGKQLRLRLSLINRNQEPSDLSPLDHNWIDLEAPRGVWTDAEPGDFARAWLVRRTADGGVTAAYREPKILRLQLPLLLGGETVTSGLLDLTMDPAAELTIRGRFVLPDGELLELPPTVWSPATATVEGGR